MQAASDWEVVATPQAEDNGKPGGPEDEARGGTRQDPVGGKQEDPKEERADHGPRIPSSSAVEPPTKPSTRAVGTQTIKETVRDRALKMLTLADES